MLSMSITHDKSLGGVTSLVTSLACMASSNQTACTGTFAVSVVRCFSTLMNVLDCSRAMPLCSFSHRRSASVREIECTVSPFWPLAAPPVRRRCRKRLGLNVFVAVVAVTVVEVAVVVVVTVDVV